VNTGTIVLFAETFKFVLSISYVWWTEIRPTGNWQVAGMNTQRLWTFCLPAFGFFLQNTLTFPALQFTDAVQFTVLMNLRLFITAGAQTLILKKDVSRDQWMSLTIMTCAVLFYTTDLCAMYSTDPMTKEAQVGVAGRAFGIFLTALISTTAAFSNVINEYVFHATGSGGEKPSFAAANSQVSRAVAHLLVYIPSFLCILALLSLQVFVFS
jgi:drug/metabolite transporter (DMT)-like permease